MNLKPQTTVKTSTTLIWKIAAGVGALGIVVASVFFAISYFGTPKDSLAGGDDHNNYTIPTEKNIIISEYGSKGHDGQQRDEFIELYNMSDTAIDLKGYSLVYFENNSSGSSVALSGIIQPDSFFVVAVRNGIKSNKRPTSNLHYDFIVPGNGWKMVGQGYVQLKYGSYVVDNAGSHNDKFLANRNYDRTDVLVDGESVNTDWTIMDNNKSTPGLINYSDMPSIYSVNSVGTMVEFGANSNSLPAISIKPQGTVLPGNVEVIVKRGKTPYTSTQMIKRYVDIVPANQPDNVELVFYYHPSELNGLSETDLALFSFYNNQWHEVGGVIDTLNNKIIATGVNHFSRWTAGLKTVGNLPITLISFEGKIQDNAVILNWETATEVNNDFFTIERSMDGIHYELVTTVKGSGNSSVLLHYSTIDRNPNTDLNYYRLKQTDYDGKFEYFPPIAVRNTLVKSELSIDKYGPNPFISELNLQVNSTFRGNITITLFNMNGSLLRAEEFNCNEGLNSVRLEGLSELKPGNYLLQISSENFKTKAIRLVKN